MGARIAMHWQATMAMTVMMGVAKQCITMPGDANDAGDAGIAGIAGIATTPDLSSSPGHTRIVV